MIHNIHKQKQGFSLVELAISLIIIALITASILTAQRLVKNAATTQLVKDVSIYAQAVEDFANFAAKIRLQS